MGGFEENGKIGIVGWQLAQIMFYVWKMDGGMHLGDERMVPVGGGGRVGFIGNQAGDLMVRSASAGEVSR